MKQRTICGGTKEMIYVIFEVTIKEGCMDNYLALAGRLKENLAQAEGFIRSERFSSLVAERKLLSLSVWEDEAAVSSWRNLQAHRMSQQAGRDSIFESYTISVASHLRSYSDSERRQAPADSNEYFNKK